MATLGTNYLTLADLAKRYGANSKEAQIIELLKRRNEILNDMLFRECNDGTKHKTTVRSGLPSVAWRKLNYGVQPGKSATKQVLDSTGLLEAWSIIDETVAATSDAGWQQTLLDESEPFLEAMRQEMATTLFYGDTTTTPEKFMGLHQRYNVLSTDEDLSGYNVFDAGGTGSDNTSIWLITHGAQAAHGIYPQGTKAGLEQKYLGLKSQNDAASGKYLAHETQFKWHCGLSVRDWRTCGRICNIDVSNLEAESSAADIVKLMIRLSERVQSGAGTPVFYMHERVKTMLRIQQLAKASGQTTFETVGGEEVMRFGSKRVATCNAILLTEARIT